MVSTVVEGLAVAVTNGIRTIRLNRPSRKNAFTQAMFKAVGTSLQGANTDDQTRVVVITGTGDYFTSGNDLNNFLNATGDPAQLAKEGTNVILELVDAFIYCKKPLVAIVNGPAVGIGVTMLGLCDAVFCSDTATFRTPFTALGQNPEACSSYTFPRIMGYAKANELLLFNQKIDAAQAEALGLVTKVFPNDKLEAEAWKRVNEMAKLPPNSLRYSKDLIRGMERDVLHKVNVAECARLEETCMSEECMEAVSKFFMTRSKI